MRFWIVGVVLAVAALVLKRLFLASRRRPLRQGGLVVITGGNAGIGEQIALIAAKRGCAVLLAAKNQQQLDRVADLCRLAGAPAVTTVSIDLTSHDERGRLASAILDAASTRPIEALVLNAGRGAITPFTASEATLDIARQMMELNYFANVDLIRRLVEKLTASRSRVLVMSSLSGVLAIPQRAQYCASKAAVQALCNSLRFELAPKGVSITLICPSYVKTEFHTKVLSVDDAPPSRKGHFMSAAKCAELSVDAMEHGVSEYMMTIGGSLAYRLRPWIPTVIDQIVAQQAKKSFK
jgi:short-subunit dehydrogenase